MSRSKQSLLVLTVLVAVGFSAMPARTADPTVEELAAKVDALEQRVAAMEVNFNRQLAQIQQKGGQPAAANQALEQQAEDAFGRINQLIAAGNQTDAKAQMNDFMQKYGSTQTAAKARRMYQELLVVGKDSPSDWGAIEKWFQGQNDVDLTSDKTTLIVFWEVWCPHCKREVPKLQQIYADLKGDGLQVVGLTKITRSATEEQVQKFVEDQKVAYPIAKENGTLSSYFNVSGIPAAAVIKDGKVIWRGHPARLNETMLKGWL